MKKKYHFIIIAGIFMAMIFSSCGSGKQTEGKTDSKDTTIITSGSIDSSAQISENSKTVPGKEVNQEKPQVFVYNFHVTNRCVSCIAIEDATTKTLKTYFAAEMKQGRIKRQILNVDDEANKTISEKYQAFGSGLFVTRVFKGKETTTDLTGDGFKFAKNKEERFIEILKNKISEYLK
ncbi:MAG: nitrophenyl compound nitroreductase subunit ArsF family protein [Bacteroidota bacterium]